MGQLLSDVRRLQQTGQWQPAEQSLRRALKLQPRNAEVLHGLGLCAHSRGDFVQALAWFDKAIGQAPGAPDVHVSRGNCLREMSRLADAVTAYRRAVDLHPDSALARFNLACALEELGLFEEAARAYFDAEQTDQEDAGAVAGRANCLLQLGRLDEALEQYGRAIAMDPTDFQTIGNRAAALQRMGRLDEAIAEFERALQGQPDLIDVWVNRGHALRLAGRPGDAVASYQVALRSRQLDASLWRGMGAALLDMGRPADALGCLERALQLAPGEEWTLFDMGRALLEERRAEDAVACFRELAGRFPQLESVGINLGVALWRSGSAEAAVAECTRVLRINPRNTSALVSRGAASFGMGRYEDAERDYLSALEATPELGKARYNLALCQLLRGDFREGWRNYEYRWSDPAIAGAQRLFPQPKWTGNGDLAGATVFLYAEQGYGDAIQFSRFVPLVAARAGRVVLEVPPALASLMRSSFEHRRELCIRVIRQGDPVPQFDLHCPLMSLPLAFGIMPGTIPRGVPYLAPSPDRVALWTSRLASRARPLVGLAWSGNEEYANRRRRSIDLAALECLTTLDVDFAGLQADIRERDLDALAQMPQLQFFAGAMRDFEDAAAIAANCDLVISIDTAAAHLAGSLGKPTWILLPHAADHRWLLDRIDSPWYPTAALFRQQIAGDWSAVIDEVKGRLAQCLPDLARAAVAGAA